MRELRQEIIRVLTPIFETERMRSVIVNEAFFDVSGITDRVDYGENARVFTSAFLHLLLKHGDVEPGVPAIIALLEVAQYYVDTSEQETLKNIIERYQQASGSTDADIMETDRRVAITVEQPTGTDIDNSFIHTDTEYVICRRCGTRNTTSTGWCTQCKYPVTAIAPQVTLPLNPIDINDPSQQFRYREQLLRLESVYDGDSILIDFSEKTEKIIGRGDSISFPDIDLSPYDETRSISRMHLLIECTRLGTRPFGMIRVKDMGSTNGTMLNNQPLLPDQAEVLRANDELRVGNALFTVSFRRRY
ncbi:MAG: FHA domain-containing protein [Chloroflexota bacterium]